MKCDFCGKPGGQDCGSGNFQCEECTTMYNFVEYEKDVVSLVTLTRHTVRIKPNTPCKDVKRLLEKVPDDTFLTLIDVDSGSRIAEFYFDVETIS